MHPEREPDPSIFAEPPEEVSHPHVSENTAGQNARYGLWLVAFYIALYGGFIALATFRHDLMASAPLGGINIAILYGIVLIVAALLLALLYMYLCREKNTGRRMAG